MNNLGICCSGLKAVELFETLPDVIPKEVRTEEFCMLYERALNRIRYECSKGIGKPRKINKGVKSWHKDHKYCGVCGFGADEPHFSYCPNCGTRYMDNEYTQRTMEAHQMELTEWLELGGANECKG